MKINSLLPPLPALKAGHHPNLKEEFDQLLYTPGKHTQGGDYYLQHQSQLQHSELSFNPLNIEHTQSALSLSAIEQKEVINELPEEPINPAQHSEQITRVHLLFESDTPPDQLMEELVSIVRDTVHFGVNTWNPELRKEPLVNKSTEVKTQTALPQSIFKKHQLFMSENTVELTLNTSQLSRHQSNELKKLIKEWLTEKGLNIKQWLINGEQQ